MAKVNQVKESTGSSQGPFCMWQGLDFPTYVKLLLSNPPLHWTKIPRLIGLTGFSITNSLMGLAERMIYGRKIAQQEVPKAPVFILGHWRSGTTLLHNLMSRDPQFTFPNLYSVLSPQHFLLTEKTVTRLTEWLLPKTRPMDNIPVYWNMPQEDEMALCNLSLLSPYIMMVFQGDRPRYLPYFDFQTAKPQELARWKEVFVTFLKRLTIRSNKTLLLKSPTHTYRVKLLLELFPDAKFVYIVRNPYAVFTSGMHLKTKLYEGNGLGRTNLVGLEEDLFQTYDHLFHVFEEDRHLLKPNQLHELRYEDLEQDPVGELRQIYRKLELSNFETLEADVNSQIDSLRKYRKNQYPPMEDSLKRRIYERWHFGFQQYGYAHDLPDELDVPAANRDVSSEPVKVA